MISRREVVTAGVLGTLATGAARKPATANADAQSDGELEGRSKTS